MALSDMYSAATVAYPLDEASGNALDAIGSVDLTDRNTTGAGTGLFYANARDLELSANEGFTASDNAALSMGDIDFFVVMWFNPESSQLQWLVSKGDTGTSANLEYSLDVQASNKPRFLVGSGSSSTTITWTGAAASNGSWNLAIGYHDSVNNLIGISLNGGAFETASCTHGSHDNANAFCVGDLTMSPLLPFDGLLQDCVIGKNYVPTDSDASALWNSGAGVAFANWAGGGGGPAFTGLIGGGVGAGSYVIGA